MELTSRQTISSFKERLIDSTAPTFFYLQVKEKLRVNKSTTSSFRERLADLTTALTLSLCESKTNRVN
jgi:hypothetical protein